MGEGEKNQEIKWVSSSPPSAGMGKRLPGRRGGGKKRGCGRRFRGGG